MRNPIFKKISPNYNKKILDIILREKGRDRRYFLPFAALRDEKISKKNIFIQLEIDRELFGHAVKYKLQNGSEGDFPADYVLYYCDPTYDWSPLNQIKRALKEKLGESKISVRVLADALNTSPSQVTRLLKENTAAKQLLQLSHMAELAGYKLEVTLKKKTA